MYRLTVGQGDNAQVFTEFGNVAPKANAAIWLLLAAGRITKHLFSPLALQVRPPVHNIIFKVIRWSSCLLNYTTLAKPFSRQPIQFTAALRLSNRGIGHASQLFAILANRDDIGYAADICKRDYLIPSACLRGGKISSPP